MDSVQQSYIGIVSSYHAFSGISTQTAFIRAHFLYPRSRLTLTPQNTVDVPLDNVVLLDLLFQPVIVGVERFCSWFYILRLQRGDIGELAAYAGQHPDQCRQNAAGRQAWPPHTARKERRS